MFHYASKEGNVEIVKKIIDGLNPGQIQIAVNKQSSTGWTPLMIAAQNGHLEIVKVGKNEFMKLCNFFSLFRTFYCQT